MLTMLIFSNVQGIAQDNGNSIFDESYVHEIRIDFNDPGTYWDSLDYYWNVAVNGGGNNYLMANVEIDGNQIDSVGVRCKGFSSYFLAPTNKKPLKIDFPEFVSGKRYDGLKKINLNNSWNAPAFLRDPLALKLLRDFGLTAPRTSYANVFINDTLWGLYIIVEQVDNKFLNNWFDDNDGDLFKCNSNTNLAYYNDSISYSFEMAPKNNDKWPDWDYYNQFLFNINFPNANFPDSLEKYLNISSFLKNMAADMIINHADGYVSSGNNFYLYLDPVSYKYNWIPWDYNLSFANNDLPLIPNFPCSGFGSYDCQYLMKSLLQYPSLKDQYLSEVCSFLTLLEDTASIYQYIEDTRNLITPFLILDSLKFYPDMTDFNASIDQTNWTSTNAQGNTKYLPGLKPFIVERSDQIRTQLNTDFGSCFLSNAEIESDKRFEIYPNPSSRYVQISYPNQTDFDLKIYNMLGEQVVSLENVNNQQELDSSDLKSGSYLVQILNLNGQSNTELLILK